MHFAAAGAAGLAALLQLGRTSAWAPVEQRCRRGCKAHESVARAAAVPAKQQCTTNSPAAAELKWAGAAQPAESLWAGQRPPVWHPPKHANFLLLMVAARCGVVVMRQCSWLRRDVACCDETNAHGLVIVIVRREYRQLAALPMVMWAQSCGITLSSSCH